MSYVQSGSCPKCGAPIYVPSVWMGITPPQPYYSCTCHNTVTVTERLHTRTLTDDERTLLEIETLLSDYSGENGDSESMVETLGRLLTELEQYRRGGASIE